MQSLQGIKSGFQAVSLQALPRREHCAGRQWLLTPQQLTWLPCYQPASAASEEVDRAAVLVAAAAACPPPEPSAWPNAPSGPAEHSWLCLSSRGTCATSQFFPWQGDPFGLGPCTP